MARRRARDEYWQDPPFAVQVELCEGCNLYCAFCGLQGIREQKHKNFKFMTMHTLQNTFAQMVALEWNPRVEFAMHGEPTMHPEYVAMVREAHRVAPHLQLMVTSNGGGLLRKPGPLENVKALFGAGLSVLALDDYDGVGIVPKVHEALHADASLQELFPDVHLYDYPAQPQGNPHMRRKDRCVSFVADISKAKTGTHSLLNNHAGAGGPPSTEAEGKRCAKPFRELSVRWDGAVAICCNDWRGIYKCGNVNLEGIESIWNGHAMHAARQKLVMGQRDFGPCKGCDAISYRTGLLPDKFGREKMEKPDKLTRQRIATACAGAPYTAQVSRPWEK